ncbi:HNH endonuclease signature motif containing protein [Sinorhizobium meliloti]|uniref:HNH endonuclease signature motif containing protein n=1 Tax=Rhizobium meliloti TaxID=382 RepID=UPI0012966027|nr:HNH endonuclease signature motif containing protein [Sinorhizobium meliloti]MDW9644459.1 HNH endonuclease [Sinorhizobium meliloti]MQV04174.1 HNH endonuclease [Sinorhizobium meliloti]
MAKLTYAQVSEVLKLAPETGRLFWRKRPTHLCKDEHQAKVWNSLYAGKEALYSINSAGYRTGCIFRSQQLAHRVVWLLHSGEWPTHNIDHINGIRTDNRIANLRAVTKAENLRNRALSSKNTSGVMGVHWSAKDERWIAAIIHDGRYIHLGSFVAFDDAVAARKGGEREYGFHPNHGRPA